MSELSDVSQDNIGLHLKNIYADAELSREATTEESSVGHVSESSKDPFVNHFLLILINNLHC